MQVSVEWKEITDYTRSLKFENLVNMYTNGCIYHWYYRKEARATFWEYIQESYI